MGVPARQEVSRGVVALGLRTVPYTVVRSSKARSIRLRMLSEGVVEIVVPVRMAVPSIEPLLRSKQRWIFRQVDRIDALPTLPLNHVRYLGEQYRVVVTRHDGRTSRLTFRDHEIHAEIPWSIDPSVGIEAVFRAQARTILRERVNAWASAMQVSHGRISVRDQRTRWGSCSTSGSLNFSWRLILAPLPVLDYVVIHELTHTREMNHGRRFWESVARYCSDFQEHRAWLKQHGALLGRPVRINSSEAD